MKKKKKVESKIPTTKTNTNRKKKTATGESEGTMASSLFKKNEFALILFGALLLTLIVFFVFFQRPGDKPESTQKPVKQSEPLVKKDLNTSSTLESPSFADLEKRIEKLENAILSLDDSPSSDKKGTNPVKERVNRLETAFDVKFGTLIERMESIEKKIAQLKSQTKAVASAPKPAPKTAVKPKAPVKKAAQTNKKEPMFHTVKKGETLYSIGRQYKISVTALQKLNNLKTNAKIYPGMNLLIR